MANELRAVLFDFDFTLGDSSRAIVDCVGCALRAVGRPMAAEPEIRACIGLTLPEVLARLDGKEPSAAEAGAFYEAFQRRADKVMEAGTVVFPEAIALMGELRGRGVRTGIVSTKLRTRIEEILEVRGLSGLFDVVVGIEDVARPKPDPAGLLLALERVGSPLEAAVYVGDHVVDALAAARAGVEFVGVLTGMTTREGFAAQGAACEADLAAVGARLRGGPRSACAGVR